MRTALSALAIAMALTGLAGAQSPDPVTGGEQPEQGTAMAPASGSPRNTPEGAAEPTPILVVDQDVLWASSAWGRRVDAEIEARRAAIAAENTRLADALEAEDAELTELRKTIPPDTFRARADAFDKRVTQVRNDRDAAARKLVEDANAERDSFLQAALPVMSATMEARGAQVLLDRLTVFLSSEAVNVTGELVAAVDDAIGTGPARNAAPAAQP